MKVGEHQKNFDSIKNDLIYLNPIIKDDRGQLFKNPGYYQNRNMPNYVPFYFKDLPVQIPLRDLRGIFSTLIPKLNRAKRKIEFSNTDFDQFFSKSGRCYH